MTTRETSESGSDRLLRFSTHPLDDHFIIRSDAGNEWVIGVDDGVAFLTSEFVNGEFDMDAEEIPSDVAEKAMTKPHVRGVDGYEGHAQSRLMADGGVEETGSDRKETVTICFLTNHEVDPDEVDLRHKDPEKIRRQLIEAADPCGNIQNVAGDDPDSLGAYREKIREVKHD